MHGDVEQHLAFDRAEHRSACSSAAATRRILARCAKLGADYGYDEINLNIGCPSERVQKGRLRRLPDGGNRRWSRSAFQESGRKSAFRSRETPKPASTGSRDYAFLRTSSRRSPRGGCRTFIVHARNAILKGLSPKENREVPPLKYAYVYRLKQDFPQLEIVINGGITSRQQIQEHLAHVDAQ